MANLNTLLQKIEPQNTSGLVMGIGTDKYLDEIIMCVTTRTPGPFWRDLLLVMMFTTFMGLCISLPISQTNDSTLGERFFGSTENLQERKEE